MGKHHGELESKNVDCEVDHGAVFSKCNQSSPVMRYEQFVFCNDTCYRVLKKLQLIICLLRLQIFIKTNKTAHVSKENFWTN